MSPTKLLDPKSDVVFKMLFGSPQNARLLLSLLNAVLRPDTPLEWVTVRNPEVERASIRDKGIVLDLRCDVSDGRRGDLEMQNQPRPARRARGLYYWARIYCAELRTGHEYDKLRPAVVILILGFKELEAERFHSTFRVREIHDGEEFSPHFELHILELPKLHLALLRNEEPLLAGWGRFFAASTEEELEALAMTDPIFREAKDALEKLSADPKARELAEERAVAERFHRIELRMEREEGRAEGREEGRAEGREEGRAEALETGRSMLVQLLEAKFGELPESARGRIAAASAAELLAWTARELRGAGSLDDVLEIAKT